MKSLLLFLLVTLQFNTYARPLVHRISKGPLHKGGTITVSIKELTEETFIARINYEIKKKRFVAVSKKHLKGVVDQELPVIFSSKEAYLLLEEVKILKVDKATLRFVKRETVGRYYDAFKINVRPDNGKWEGFFWYHPSIRNIGWFKAELIITKLPIIDRYTIKSQLKE